MSNDAVVLKVTVSPVQGSAAPLAKKTVSLIEKEIIEKRISNNEYRISNVEGMHSIDFY
jgi:hypothetical protein